MNNQSAKAAALRNPVEKEDMAQMMLMTFLPVALMVIRLSILAMH